jgi:hypothetical protein
VQSFGRGSGHLGFERSLLSSVIIINLKSGTNFDLTFYLRVKF